MMLMIPGAGGPDPGGAPDAGTAAALASFNESLRRAGVLLALDGLHPPAMGARVSFAGGTPRVTDGPIAVASEVVGGYWVIQARSRDEAIEWASRCPLAEGDVIEIRQVREASALATAGRKVV